MTIGSSIAFVVNSINSAIEDTRASIDKELDISKRSELGQFMTNWNIAKFMSSLMNLNDIDLSSPIRILDPGAGVGSLSAALAERITKESNGKAAVKVDTYEIDQTMRKGLENTGNILKSEFSCKHNIKKDDFIESAVSILAPTLEQVGRESTEYDFVILNPPYKKISSTSLHRRLLSMAGIETTNLYTAFWQLSIRLTKPGGQICAIVPRSFCNGTYFKAFRQYLKSSSDIKHIHVFDSRKDAFKDNDVLQENVIVYTVKKSDPDHEKENKVVVSRSADDTFLDLSSIALSPTQIWGEGPDRFLYIPTSTESLRVIETMNSLPHSLHELGLKVSTGPVVQFRLRSSLSFEGGIPMLYCSSMSNGQANQNLESKKSPPYIELNSKTEKWLVNNSCYLIIRRFSSKEEKRRIVCAVYNPGEPSSHEDKLGIDNKLNYYYSSNGPLSPEVANGLYVFLSSTIVDSYYRLVSGHTQVNSGDLRSLKYPSLSRLHEVGKMFMNSFSSLQEDIDNAASLCFSGIETTTNTPTSAICITPKDSEELTKIQAA